jgi:acyl-CoA hydrolase
MHRPSTRLAATMGRPEDVLRHVPAGADVVVAMAAGEPSGLITTLEEHASELSGVRIHQMHAPVTHPHMRGECGPGLRHVSYFLSPATRQAYADGLLDLVPANFSEVPAILRRCTACTLVLAQASPPDAQGNFSLGTNADYLSSLIGRAPFFLAVNPEMPRTYGQNQIHVSQIAGWTEVSAPIHAAPVVTPDKRDEAIAEHILDRIPDGATIQAGIGGIPNAVMAGLHGRRELGVHTELISDGLMELVLSGAVTNTRKHHWRNKILGTFAFGSKDLYDWMNHNGGIEMAPVDIVNDPRRIAREPSFVSINATTEVDLYGQCASETVAGRYYSGSGGQADFARGAMYSEGGQAFIVTKSTTGSGRSRIRSRLTEGSVVTTLKNTVDNVVTEFGIAELWGKSFGDRARALIDIAHPDHREELEREAHEMGLLRGGRPR